MKIAIASGKGGTGKTTISTNLAKYTSEQEETVLADLDVEEPNSKIFIQGQLIDSQNKFTMVPNWKSDKCTFCGKCSEVCYFNAITQLPNEILVFPKLCHSCYACSELCPVDALPMQSEKMGVMEQYQDGNLSFIESKLDIGQEQAVPLIEQTIDFVDQKYPDETIKFFDTPPGTSCPVIEAMKSTDYVILVTEPTPFGLHDLKLAAETVKKLDIPHGVVINRYGIGNAGVEEYCEEEDIPIIATIPNSRKVAELYSNGDLLYKEIEEVKQAMENIYQTIEDYR